MREPLGTSDFVVILKTPFAINLRTFACRDSWYWSSSCRNTVILGFLRGRPLLRFTGKGAGSLPGLFAGSTLVPSICVVEVRYGLIEVARKVVLP
jgi:hypothetical protein